MKNKKNVIIRDDEYFYQKILDINKQGDNIIEYRAKQNLDMDKILENIDSYPIDAQIVIQELLKYYRQFCKVRNSLLDCNALCYNENYSQSARKSLDLIIEKCKITNLNQDLNTDTGKNIHFEYDPLVYSL